MYTQPRMSLRGAVLQLLRAMVQRLHANVEGAQPPHRTASKFVAHELQRVLPPASQQIPYLPYQEQLMDLLNRLWRYRLRAWLSAPRERRSTYTGRWHRHMTPTRSLRFNASDPAAVVHRALKVVAASATIVDTLLCATETTTAQNTVPGSPNELQPPPLGQAATLALAEYANACAFLHEQAQRQWPPLTRHTEP